MTELILCPYLEAHSKACIAPIEPPITANNLFIPNFSISLFCTLTLSLIVITGKFSPYGFVSGLFDSGPVVPMQPPNTLLQIT